MFDLESEIQNMHRMGKLLVVSNLFKDLDPKAIEHNDVIMENKAGRGGGQHLMLDIWDSRNDDIKDQKHLQPVVLRMLEIFETFNPALKVRNYRIEHRVYIVDDEKFTGRIHDDSCEYSILLYYRIDSDIKGGVLYFYDDDAEHIIDSYIPNTGDLVILDGVHALGELYATTIATRSIIIVHINSED